MNGPPASDAARPGREALEAIDAILGARPHKDDYRISQAAELLCAWRETLIAREENAVRRDRLERLNAVLAMVLAAHFPIGATPWDDLAKARGWLSDLLADEG